MEGMKALREIGSAVADILWPAQCHVCGQRPGPSSRWLCAKCLRSLPRFAATSWDLNPMARHFAGQVPFERASAFLEYNAKGMLAPVFHDFKYRGFPSLARYMGELAGGGMPDFFDGVETLLPVPMFALKQLRRGYNQAREIALGLSRATGIPVGRGLKAIRGHRTQTGMTSAERQANTRGIFRYRPPIGQLGATVCLVDDVCTTGSTLLSCTRAVLDADPAARLRIFALGAVLDY